MKNISIITLLCAAFFVGCSSKSKLSKKQKRDFYLSIEKTPCFGQCPMYEMHINGVGEAQLDAKRFMDNIGEFTATLSATDMSNVIRMSNEADWSSYDAEYLTGYSDLPSTIIRFSKKAGDTTEVRYESDKAPLELRVLAEQLDSLQKATVWQSVILN